MGFLDTPANIESLRNSFISRGSVVTLRVLTNDGKINTTTATVNTAKVDLAIRDAVGDFSQLAGVEPDLLDPSHVSALCTGIFAYLYQYKGRNNKDYESNKRSFVVQCRAIRDAGNVPLGTSSQLTTPDERGTSSGPIYPDMARRNFADYLPSKRGRNRRVYNDEYY